jgi:hypothetical protein
MRLLLVLTRYDLLREIEPIAPLPNKTSFIQVSLLTIQSAQSFFNNFSIVHPSFLTKTQKTKFARY